MVYEYVIVVDPDIPILFAVTTPVEGLMVATLVLEDDHVPPKYILDKVVVDPAQILVDPSICESVVGKLTVTIVVTELVHPYMLV